MIQIYNFPLIEYMLFKFIFSTKSHKKRVLSSNQLNTLSNGNRSLSTYQLPIIATGAQNLQQIEKDHNDIGIHSQSN